MKIYEPVIDSATGNIRIETELTPDEIKSMLVTALMICLQNGMAPQSIARYFEKMDGPEEEPVEVARGEQIPLPLEETKTKVRSINDLTQEEQKKFLSSVNPQDIPQA